MPEDLKEDGAVCTELGIAAVISFHRGDIPGARRYLATAAPYAARLQPRLVASLALARSLDYEYAGALPEALAALTGGCADSREDIEEAEEVFGDVVRLAIAAGDLAGARAFAGQAATLAAGSEVPHRQATALYCRGLLDGDAPLLLAAAERYEDASRPLMRAKALEAAAEHFLRADDRSQARAAFTGAVEAYVSLGAAADAARLDAAFRAPASGAGRALNTGRPATAGIASPRPRSRLPPSSPKGCPTRKSPSSWCYPGGLSRPMSPTS